MSDRSTSEMSAIGVLLAFPADAMAVAKSFGARAEWFAGDPWRLLWEALDAIWLRGEIRAADAVSVMAEAKRIDAGRPAHERSANLSAEMVDRALQASSAADPTLHLVDVRNAYVERRTRSALAVWGKRAGSYADASVGVVEMVTQLQAIASDATSSKKIDPARVLGEVMAETEEAWHMRVDPNGPRDLSWVPGFRMPWPELTRVMGGLRAGLHIIAARPSVGKTSFAVNLIRFWCEMGRGDGKPAQVLFDSLDMPRKEVLRRFIAEKARVSASKLLFSPTRSDIEDAQAAVDAVKGWPLTVCEIRDVDDLRSYCMVEHAAGRLDVLVIDYLGQLHSRSKEDPVEYARVSYASDTLKNLASELQIPVVALCQLNRESAKPDASGVPGLTDLRGSGTIEQDAFTVAVLYRDDRVVNGSWKTNPPLHLMPSGARYGVDALDSVWWNLVKSQNGGSAKFPFVVRKQYFAWSLGNYAAQAEKKTEGYGSTQKTYEDNTARFARVHADWRHDPIENELRRQGALIESDGTINVGPPPLPAPVQNDDDDDDE